ncbi:MAG TPA: hypothetical protein ENG00_00095 [Candidatus Aenigmarchaeota archaeon]|nr:hypothetical protein [Candidatus Aenigmarchaeota archaeon]
MKAQTTMILLVFLIMIFTGLVIVLLSLSQTVVREEYSDLYVNNLLLSILKTNTGYTDRCETVSDLIGCAFLTPSYTCGGSSLECRTLAEQTLEEYMNMVNENMVYCFNITSGPGWSSLDEQGLYSISFGDSSIWKKGINRRVARTVIQSVHEGLEYNIEVTLAVAFRK